MLSKTLQKQLEKVGAEELKRTNTMPFLTVNDHKEMSYVSNSTQSKMNESRKENGRNKTSGKPRLSKAERIQNYTSYIDNEVDFNKSIEGDENSDLLINIAHNESSHLIDENADEEKKENKFFTGPDKSVVKEKEEPKSESNDPNVIAEEGEYSPFIDDMQLENEKSVKEKRELKSGQDVTDNIVEDRNKSVLLIEPTQQEKEKSVPDANEAEGFEEAVEAFEVKKLSKTEFENMDDLKKFSDLALQFSNKDADGKSATFMALRKALLKADRATKLNDGKEKESILKQLSQGKFVLNDDNYALYLELYQAVSAYVADHVSSRSSATKRRYESAAKMKKKLDLVSDKALTENDVFDEKPELNYSEEEQKAAVTNVDKQLDFYIAYCRNVDADPIASAEEKLRRKWDAFKIFERDVAIYIDVKRKEALKKNEPLSGKDAFIEEEYHSLKLQIRLRDLTVKSGFKKAFKNESAELVRDHSYKMHPEGIKKQRDRMSTVDGDDGLSTEQVRALNMIDEWIVRNVRNRNIASPFSSANRLDIASKLLSMSRRKRLYIYYLVETRKRVDPQIDSIYLSQDQSIYIPSVAGFKKQMIASRWKFYKRISRSNIYWEKLQQAMYIADQATPIINEVSRYMKPDAEDKNREDEEQQKDLAQEQSDLSEIKKYLLKFANNAKMASDCMKEKETAAENEKQELQNKLKQLQAEGKRIIQKMCRSAQIAIDRQGESLHDSEKMEAISHYSGTLVGDTSKTIDIVTRSLESEGVFKSIIESEAQLTQVTECYTHGMGVIGGVSAAIGACIAFAAMIKDPSSLTLWDRTTVSISFVKSISNSLSSAGLFVNSVINGSKEFANAAPVISVAFAGVETVNALIKTGSAIRNGYHRHKAMELLTREREPIQGEDGGQDERYIEGLEKLHKKLSQRDAIAATGSIVTAGVSVTAACLILTGAATAGITAIIGGVLLAGSLAFRAIDRAYSKGMKNELFDAYFEIPKLYDDVKAKWKERNDGEEPTKNQEKAILKSLRERVAAERGYFSVTQATRKIASDYAGFMLKKANEDGPDREGYIHMIKGLGLRYSYDSVTGEVVPKETDIVKKLCR